MAEWGFRVWDENRKDINTGFVRILALGTVQLSQNQVSGAWSFTVPAGFVLDYLSQSTAAAGTTTRRRFTVSGSTVSISDAGSSYAADTEPAGSSNVIFYLRKA